MPEVTSPNSQSGRKIEIRLAARSLAPRVLSALVTLGYTFSETTKAELAKQEISRIWLADETRLDEIPDADGAADARILLITSPRRYAGSDRRILAQTVRPGDLSSVYAMLQTTLEDTPRRTPRVQTKLSARCLRAEHRSSGAVLSLSEGGCLFRTGARLRSGAHVDLQFALPQYGLVSTPAECRYVRSGDVGFEFADAPSDVRNSIAHYVTTRLASI
jgi:hypothetical protein